VVYPAQFWPHKNHVGLLLAFKRAREEHGVDLQLVLCGSDKGNLAHVRATAAEMGLAEHVVFAGFVSETELVWLYRNARALVFPSFFGPDNLPPLEAMQLGCPVIAARVPGTEEQLGDAALLVDPRSVEDIAAAIARVNEDQGLRTTLVDRGRARAARWTPTQYAAAMMRVADEFETERRCWSRAEPYVQRD
jgi:glycosyltransferase involved in cell wall biosynthesis